MAVEIGEWTNQNTYLNSSNLYLSLNQCIIVTSLPSFHQCHIFKCIKTPVQDIYWKRTQTHSLELTQNHFNFSVPLSHFLVADPRFPRRGVSNLKGWRVNSRQTRFGWKWAVWICSQECTELMIQKFNLVGWGACVESILGYRQCKSIYIFLYRRSNVSSKDCPEDVVSLCDFCSKIIKWRLVFLNRSVLLNFLMINRSKQYYIFDYLEKI